MFSTQDSVDFGQSGEAIGYPQESASPVRKKGRSKHFLRDTSNKSDVNPFGFSQDSVGPSQQFSQNFTDRMGQLNMFCSQDNSNISSSESAFSVPFMSHLGIATEASRGGAIGKFGSSNQFGSHNNSGGNLHSLSSNNNMKVPEAGSTASSANFDSERPIDVAPSVKNVFLTGCKLHSELYINPTDSTKGKSIKPIKVWIGAFKERPRIITEFEEVQLLGEGTFSTVICARHRLDGTLFAIKRIRESIVSVRQGHTLLREVNALAALQGCAQVVKYHSCWIDNHHLFIQTELCHLGSLEDIIAPHPNHSSILHTAQLARQFFINGGHRSSSSSGRNRASHERNRSESFNSIDLNDYEELIHDEYATAPGPPNIIKGNMPSDVNTGTSTPQGPVPVGLFFSQPTSTQNTATHTNNTSSAYNNPLPPSQYTQNSVHSMLSQSSNNQCMDEGNNSGFYTQEAAPATLNITSTTHNNPTNKNSAANSVHRGITEDLAWLLLFEISAALKYMHDREMVHLDLRPANIFLTSSPSYHEMDSQDPQRLVICSMVAPTTTEESSSSSSSGIMNNSGNNGGGGDKKAGTSVPLFAHILNAAPLQYALQPTTATTTTTNTTNTNTIITSSNTTNTTTSTTTTTTTNTPITSHFPSTEAVSFDIRTHVERLLVQRKYVIKLGDLGHCCRIDEKSQFQEGQTRYLARELINMEEDSFDAYKSDIFSLGATIYELCLGRYLGAEGEEGIAEWHSIRDGKLDVSLNQRFSRPLVEILHLLTHPDPTARPSAHTLYTSLLPAMYRGDNREIIFGSGNTGDIAGNSGGGDSEIDRLRVENKRLREQLGLV